MKYLLPLTILLCSTGAFGECFQVGEFSGVSGLRFDEFKLSEDGLSEQIFALEINGENSTITPNNGVTCVQVMNFTLFCIGSSDTVEIYSVYPFSGVATYQQLRNYSNVPQLDGVKLFIGKILGRC